MNEALDKIAAQLAARGYYTQLQYLRDADWSEAAKKFVWICDLENDILGMFPRGQGESALLALERARASLGHVEEARRSASE
jgi:hypothetical protein